ncbi:MAG TPA: hypothetical protein VFM93_03270 [Candidatus Limnocylindria bacterium]|nr:hypothetical protein [Candidatus Limnocylindria bacterium]
MRALLLSALLAVAAPAAAQQYVVVLLPTTGSNVPEGQLAAAGDVLRAYLESTGRFMVIRGAPTAPVEASPFQAAQAARQANASLAIALHVTRLQETGIVRVAAYDPEGRLVHSDQIGSLGADDLDPGIKRLADSIAGGRRAREGAEIDTVTAREEAPLRKMVSSQSFGLRLAAYLPVQRPDPHGETSSPAGLGLVWQYDARTWMADVALEGFLSNLDADRPDRDRGISLGIGAYYPFARTDVSPYLGGGVAYAATRFDGNSGSGLQGRLAGGLMLGRLSDVSVRFEVGWFVNAYTTREVATDKEIHVQGATASLTLVAVDHRRRR